MPRLNLSQKLRIGELRVVESGHLTAPVSRCQAPDLNFLTGCLTAMQGKDPGWLAESLNDPFHRRLRPLRFLHGRFGCYRLERPVAGWELHPLKVHAFARRTRNSG
jgi:hypothetical protein